MVEAVNRSDIIFLPERIAGSMICVSSCCLAATNSSNSPNGLKSVRVLSIFLSCSPSGVPPGSRVIMYGCSRRSNLPLRRLIWVLFPEPSPPSKTMKANYGSFNTG